MDKKTKFQIIETIRKRELLRPLSRLNRLIKDPIRSLPFYILATISHMKPFPITFKTLWGDKMTCYLPEGNTFYYYGYAEANLTNFFLRYIKDDSISIDVGAHVGFYSILLSRLSKMGQVHSFEPTPWTFKILKKNTGLLDNVTTNNLALTESTKTLSFADYGPGYGAFNTAHKNGASALKQTPHITTVKGVSLDNYCKKHALRPDLIKIDAEGFEYNVLSGMTSILTKDRPIITLEVAGDEAWKDNLHASLAILKQHSYLPYEMDISGLVRPHQLQSSYKYDNLLFIPIERLPEIDNLQLN